ncbi:hypothetical protein [Mitsuokella multacida]|uniref:hypothetical protein n=1 Tax=Mitsuokella multacida TaxID=52226 RepID=UPI0022E75B0E|nr:hypothetical protein [Mitsuokella multacida]
MEMTWLCHLAYAFMPAVTLLWGEALRARFLYRGARRAVRLLVAALLAWQSVRLLKYMLEPVPDAGDGLINAFWYLYYVFRAALPVALLWIAHVADRDAVARRMPPHLLALLLLNLVLAAAILTNDWHEQVFSFPQEREGGEWEEKLEWGAYAYWVIWFLEVFAALAILWVKAGLQKIWRPQMVLPVALCGLFLAYSIFYNFLPLVRIDVTFTTTGFFLLLLELCLQTGLMPSNDEHESFFREASPGLMLLDEKGRAPRLEGGARRGSGAEGLPHFQDEGAGRRHARLVRGHASAARAAAHPRTGKPGAGAQAPLSGARGTKAARAGGTDDAGPPARGGRIAAQGPPSVLPRVSRGDPEDGGRGAEACGL